ncbi:(2Fe-2S)-binding protein [Reichenbachiella versicolor]|uniref:(2Fe-2S)-binding protein n=1 Tax=Reichenbachiella versicolor TaxID=1821036 RepID=UPI000D6E4AE2|nr:(2Fe-2S)-binding protein [Reichenbachiella versicolor]
MKIDFELNGKPTSVDVDGTTPLLWVIRDTLGFTGTKFGCGMAQCGCCTIHFNGMATRSCMLPIQAAKGAKITTIEGIAKDGKLHPVQQAWIEKDVAQCGYCQAGQVMTAVNLLERNSKPTDEEIERAMEGNICRCGTYHRIKDAVKHASELMNNQ